MRSWIDPLLSRSAWIGVAVGVTLIAASLLFHPMPAFCALWCYMWLAMFRGVAGAAGPLIAGPSVIIGFLTHPGIYLLVMCLALTTEMEIEYLLAGSATEE